MACRGVAIAGVALFVLGWVFGWEAIEPIEVDALGPIAGSGAFGGVVSTPWDWQTTWLIWASGSQ